MYVCIFETLMWQMKDLRTKFLVHYRTKPLKKSAFPLFLLISMSATVPKRI